MSFRDLSLPQPILQALDDAGYVNPTEIQALAIPPALEGRDVLGRAKTGPGKTAAFAIPILVRLKATPSWDPSAQQVESEESQEESAPAEGENFAARSRRRRRRGRAPVHAHRPVPTGPRAKCARCPHTHASLRSERESFRAYGVSRHPRAPSTAACPSNDS
jgi:superfamily II DNA/RNA helicase